MAFPTSPANNQTALVNGIVYQWNNTLGAWKRNGSVTSISVGQVLLTSAQTSITNGSGSLIVAGGAGISGNIYSGGIYITGSANGITFSDSTFQNTAFTGTATDTTARTTANSASSYANGAFVAANTADQRAVTSGAYANSSYIHANAAFAAANSAAGSSTDTFARAQANASFVTANSASSYANGAFAAANTADQRAVTSGSYANAAFGVANGKFSSSGGTISGDTTITGNLTVSGQTTYANTITVNLGDNIITLNADLPPAAQPSENAGIEIDRGAQPNAQFLWIESAGKWSANNGNTSFYIGSESDGSYANSAYQAANSAGSYANSAYNAANNATDTWVRTAANSASSYANGAFNQANTANTLAQAAYDKANTGGGGSGNSFSVIATTPGSGYSNIIATAADSVLTITGESGIVVGLDPTTNKIVIGNMYVGAQDITLDYGTLDYFTDAIRYDYGFVS